MAGRSASSETMPSLRALLAKTTNCRTTCCGSSLGSEKTVISRRKAVPTTGNGNCSITAPSVPPKTIMAAVGCRICEILPPSSSRPATTPPTPTASPAKLLLSTAGLRCAGRGIGEAVRIGKVLMTGAGRTLAGAPDDGATKLQHPLDHLTGGFTHHELLAVEQRDDRVRGLLDILNKVGVERQAGIVQANELDHRRPRLGGTAQRGHRQKLPSA